MWGVELAEKMGAGPILTWRLTPDMMGGGTARASSVRDAFARAGTVTQDVTNAVREYKAGKVEFRADDTGIVHCVAGKLSFSETQIAENVDALLRYIRSLKPASSKGVYIRSITITATMSPGISIVAA